VGLSLYLKARFKDQGPHGKVDINKEMESNPNWLRDGRGPAHRLDIVNLFVACHSGGGYGAMIPLVKALGRFQAPVLKECWGFDCLYPADWTSFCREHQRDLGLFFYAGQGTTGRKQPGAREVVFQQSQAVYGTPTRPTPVYTDAVRLALAFDGVETDRVAFRPVQDIQRQVVPPTAYEKARKTLDPFLDNQTKYWNAFDKDNDWLELKGHFDVPADLLTPRIKSAMT
jgi:hypothetical protein